MHTPAFTALFLLCGAISIAYAAPLRSRDDVQVVSGQVSSADHGFFHTEDAVLYSDGVFDFDETNGGAYHIYNRALRSRELDPWAGGGTGPTPAVNPMPDGPWSGGGTGPTPAVNPMPDGPWAGGGMGSTPAVNPIPDGLWATGGTGPGPEINATGGPIEPPCGFLEYGIGCLKVSKRQEISADVFGDPAVHGSSFTNPTGYPFNSEGSDHGGPVSSGPVGPAQGGTILGPGGNPQIVRECSAAADGGPMTCKELMPGSWGPVFGGAPVGESGASMSGNAKRGIPDFTFGDVP